MHTESKNAFLTTIPHRQYNSDTMMHPKSFIVPLNDKCDAHYILL